jgi:L-2-hydroxyglutarate oxidase LhgO
MESVLPDLQQKAWHNGVEDIRLLSRDDVKYLEPDIECVGALLSPSTGVLDSHSYYMALLADAESHGVTLSLHSTVDRARVETISCLDHDSSSRGDIRLQIDGTWVQCQAVVNSAGLSADHVARLLHQDTPATRGNTNFPPWTPPRHYYAKGTYFRLAGKKPSFRHLIYPIPERGGLGIHATIDWSGTSIKFGPNVEWMDPSIVQSSKDIDLNPDPLLGEQFSDAVRTYWPDLQDGQLAPDYVGIRPKLHHPSQLSSLDETLGFMDFSILGPSKHGIPGLVHLFGIESPGLTSSMAIADYVRDMLLGNERR